MKATSSRGIPNPIQLYSAWAFNAPPRARFWPANLSPPRDYERVRHRRRSIHWTIGGIDLDCQHAGRASADTPELCCRLGSPCGILHVPTRLSSWQEALATDLFARRKNAGKHLVCGWETLPGQTVLRWFRFRSGEGYSGRLASLRRTGKSHLHATLLIRSFLRASVGGATGPNDSGAAYVFVRSGTNWVEQAKLRARDRAEDDQFGRSVAILGSTLVVGASQAMIVGQPSVGAAYVFVRQGTNWVEQTRLIARDGVEFDLIGQAVAINGETVVIGASRATLEGRESSGVAQVFGRVGTNWIQQAKLTATDGAAGDRLVMSVHSRAIRLSSARSSPIRESTRWPAPLASSPSCHPSPSPKTFDRPSAVWPGRGSSMSLLLRCHSRLGACPRRPRGSAIWIQDAGFGANGVLLRRISGPTGNPLHLQASPNLANWTTLTTVTLMEVASRLLGCRNSWCRQALLPSHPHRPTGPQLKRLPVKIESDRGNRCKQ